MLTPDGPAGGAYPNIKGGGGKKRYKEGTLHNRPSFICDGGGDGEMS